MRSREIIWRTFIQGKELFSESTHPVPLLSALYCHISVNLKMLQTALYFVNNPLKNLLKKPAAISSTYQLGSSEISDDLIPLLLKYAIHAAHLHILNFPSGPVCLGLTRIQEQNDAFVHLAILTT